MGRLIPASGITWVATSAGGVGLGISINFIPTRAIQIDGLDWYRPNTTAGNKPNNVKLWDGETNRNLDFATVVPDNGAVGWQEWDSDGSLVLQPGKLYKVSAYWPSTTTIPILAGAYSGVPDSPVLINNPQRCTTASNTDTIPLASCDNASIPGLNVRYTVAPPPATGGDVGTAVSNELADWLSLADETHGADNIVKLALDILQAEEGIIQTVDAKVEDIQTWFQGALGVNGNLLTGALRVYLDGLKNTIDLVQAQVDLVRDTDVPAILESTSGIGSGGRPVADTSGVLDPGYVLTDTKVGVGADTWDVPADRYVLTITNPGDLTGGMTINGVPFFRHRGRWAPLEIDLVGHYYPLLGEKHLLYESGRRLPGVLLYLEPHIEWTLEAFDYVPPAP